MLFTSTAPRPLAAPRLRAGALWPALLAACAAVATWVAAAAWLNQSQLGDSLEQFVWGSSLEWGYWKHPPLTTWLMWAALRLAGPTPLVTYALAAVLAMVTIACTTRLAQLLAGDDVAVATALLLALHYGLTRRAQMYNHNTVLLACVAAAALLVLLAVRRNRPRDWALAGLAAGLALLAKYQAALPLAGMLLALTWTGELRRCRAGIALAAAVATLVLLPHLAWMASHDFQTWRYAMTYVSPANAPRASHRFVPFLAMQAKYFLPVAAFALLLWLQQRRAPRPMAPVEPRWSQPQRAWLAGLVLLPLAAVLAAAAAGVRVQSHWGMQTTQFLAVALALLLVRRFGPWRAAHWRAWTAVQVLGLSVFVAQGLGWLGDAGDGGVRAIPAQHIARSAVAHWETATGCELRYVSGPVAMAGLVAAYGGRAVQVLEDGDANKSPWIDRADMRAHGWLQLRQQDGPAHAEGELLLRLPPRQPERPYLVAEVHRPEASCRD